MLFQFKTASSYFLSYINFTCNMSYHGALRATPLCGLSSRCVGPEYLVLIKLLICYDVYTYALCTAKFVGKIAFGFIKSNMNFPVPKDTKRYLFFTQYIFTETLEYRISFLVQITSPDLSTVAHFFASCEKAGHNG